VIVTALDDIQPGQLVVVDIALNVARPVPDGSYEVEDGHVLARAAAGIRIPRGECGSVEPVSTATEVPALTLRLPAHCPSCGRRGSVRLQQRVLRSEVGLTWCCRACDHEWAIQAPPVQPRRTRTVP
jgi:hypothetical protein